MVKFLLLSLLVTGLLIGGKAEVWLFPFPFSHLRFSFFVFHFFASFASLCARGVVRAKEKTKCDFWEGKSP